MLRLATVLRGPQDHKMIQAGRKLRALWSNLLLTSRLAVRSNQAAQGFIQLGLKNL